MKFLHTVELLPAWEQPDAYGTPRRIPAPAGTTVGATVQAASSAEESAEGQRIIDGYRAFLPPGVDLDGFGYLRWEGVLYEVVGDPGRHDTMRGAHHLEVELRRVR